MSKKVHEVKVYSESGDDIPPQELARLLGDLRYDAMAEYLDALAKKLSDDSRSDGGRGRGQLAERLQRAAFALDEARLEIKEAWAICAPYMVSKVPDEKEKK
jgi:hypothetical protein